MAEHFPWRCRVLRLFRMHGIWWTKDAGTPIRHDACKGCGHMFKIVDPYDWDE